MRRWPRIVLGFAAGSIAFWALLLVVGLLIAGATRPMHNPVPQEQARIERHETEVRSQAYEEEQRRNEYVARR